MTWEYRSFVPLQKSVDLGIKILVISLVLQNTLVSIDLNLQQASAVTERS